ncbi:unnamed protein product [Phytophthora fragariaefolia]|uniref:DNA-directed DNA polymerase n=1 Tax=Phytophthora fragariaefolia TaxID=1490495 RepID=A0A9W6XLT0_9STRA|nr:unnamed protein product [Phytophthora fragariaefolia]
MARDNGKYHLKHKLADFDAVSLYPSAMSELPGYVRGKGKLFKDSIPSDADYFVARVRFDSINIKRHFPLLSYYENGSRNFTNDIIGRSMIVVKQALEDIVRFQGASYTVIEGIYWNEGFNNRITKTTSKIFNARLKYKAEGNPLQEVLKLMMNSSYGKLLMKPIVKKKVFVSGGEKKINEYTHKNIHRMISKTPISDNLALFEEHKALSQHFSPVHLGIQILNSSKHIMNRVMCLAEDIHAHIWYQDSDSMHIDYDSVQRLADAYRDLYSKELIGKQMGQFHADFDLAGSKGNIFARESIILGKKSYLDVLACDGNDTTGLHIHIKGIPGKLLEGDAYATYMKLFNGQSVSFDLTELCSININSKTQSVSKRSCYVRTDKLYRKAKAFDKNITKQNVSEWYKRQQSIQQFSSRSKRFPQFKFAYNNPNEWQMNLAFWEKQRILISVNINSRIGFAKILNNKRAETVLKAIEDFVDKNNVSAIFSDNGSEFFNKSVERFFDERSISHGNAIAGDHTVLGKIDRFIRTIKSKLTKMKQIIRFKKQTQSILNEAIANYNNTHHSAINATPSEMRGKVMLDDVEYNKRLVKKIITDIPPGSIVRCRLNAKTPFDKEGARWSRTAYEVVGFDGLKIPISSDAEINDRVNQFWEVEKIMNHENMRNGKCKYLIKWKGYDEPSWEPQDNLRLITKNKRSELEKKYWANNLI